MPLYRLVLCKNSMFTWHRPLCHGSCKTQKITGYCAFRFSQVKQQLHHLEQISSMTSSHQWCSRNWNLRGTERRRIFRAATSLTRVCSCQRAIPTVPLSMIFYVFSHRMLDYARVPLAASSFTDYHRFQENGIWMLLHVCTFRLRTNFSCWVADLMSTESS